LLRDWLRHFVFAQLLFASLSQSTGNKTDFRDITLLSCYPTAVLLANFR